MKNPSSSAIWKTAAVHRMKNKGPRTEPWGTLNWTTVVEDVVLLYLMYCLLPTRYERNQSRTAPPNPNDTSSRRRRMLWSTQSKAVLRSSIPSRVSLPMSAAIRASANTFKRAVSVEWLRRYADWCSGRRPFEWRCRSILSLTARSSTFEMNGKFKMGL